MRSGASRAGVTLVEVMVSVAAFVALGLLLFMVYTNMFQGLATLSVKARVTNQLRSAMEQFGQDIRAAQAFLGTCGGYTFSAHGDVLILQMSSTANVVYQCSDPAGNRQPWCNGGPTNPQTGRLDRMLMNSACTTKTSVQVVVSAGTNQASANNPGVIALGFDRPGSGKRVVVRLRARDRLQRVTYNAELIEGFNMRQ